MQLVICDERATESTVFASSRFGVEMREKMLLGFCPQAHESVVEVREELLEGEAAVAVMKVVLVHATNQRDGQPAGDAQRARGVRLQADPPVRSRDRAVLSAAFGPR